MYIQFQPTEKKHYKLGAYNIQEENDLSN